MSDSTRHDAWSAGESYDVYMGRWSQEVANLFLDRLDPPDDLDWLDVGCGTGALSRSILERCSPRSLVGIDPAQGFVSHARERIVDERATFEVGGAEALARPDDCVDIAASALAYNFVPDRARALAEMRRVVRPRGQVALYVWDYPGGGMGFIDAFWTAAVALDPDASLLDEAARFPFCNRDTLGEEAREAGLHDVEVEAIEITTRFDDIKAFWQPFTRGAGPAPGYCANLPDAQRAALRQRLADDLESQGPIELPARAWAVQGRTD